VGTVRERRTRGRWTMDRCLNRACGVGATRRWKAPRIAEGAFASRQRVGNGLGGLGPRSALDANERGARGGDRGVRGDAPGLNAWQPNKRHGPRRIARSSRHRSDKRVVKRACPRSSRPQAGRCHAGFRPRRWNREDLHVAGARWQSVGWQISVERIFDPGTSAERKRRRRGLDLARAASSSRNACIPDADGGERRGERVCGPSARVPPDSMGGPGRYGLGRVFFIDTRSGVLVRGAPVLYRMVECADLVLRV
jgi:hypothetical protein